MFNGHGLKLECENETHEPVPCAARELTIGDASDVKEIKFSLMQYIELITRDNMESKPTEDCPA